ncbi:Por secretion system C-terminal sorting domain-containing protein [Polaribacter sp. KT25b]|uniref:glycosyl hydrolase n=1 Tax=Polaribacter sp. KT25b TaxID=1855336 RepID=UPI00087A6422|nr:glycosyl hydrolase [Polaribacter sp. KT25b]SDS58841.1 Por secretion system C-terminal sorting domain-containing protein [Polaribacter sp. KT25b]
MKLKLLYIIASLFAINNFAQTTSCETIVEDTFDTAGVLSEGWTEYSTSGSVTVVNDYLKFNLAQNTPSAYRTFASVSNNCSLSFDVQGSRNTMNFQMDLVSSDGKYIASIALGKATSDIKYATEMVDVIPGTYIAGVIGTAKFAKNKNYSLSMYVDFDNQTVDFYNDGELTLENIPFLETTTDFTKVDTKLLYMYSNSGTVFLDNLTVIEANESRIALSNAVQSSQNLLSSASVGEKYSQYPQAAIDAFQLVVDNGNTILSDCDSAASIIDNALAELKEAQDVFSASQVNDPVLKVYNSYNFGGEEHEIYVGYYNGDLGLYDDWIASFTLDKGYMVTFAENINGTGFSKVYVASEEDLRINLTEDLYKKISFIRVGPWRDTLKKGSSGKSSTNDVTLALNTSWFYDWGNGDTDIEGNEYVVMNWGGTPSLATMEKLGKQMNTTHHLAFNEPDGEKQANMSVDVAVARYATLQASGLRLGAPAVTDGTKGRAWLDEFMTKAKAAGYRIDFIPVHYYKIMTASNFKAWLKDFYDEYQVPIWVTEFNYGDIWAANEKTKTEAQVLTNIKAYCEMMDDADFIERYCIFTWQPSETSAQTVMSVRNPIVLNTVGEFYKNHESPVAYIQETYEQGVALSLDKNVIAPKFSVYPTVITNGVFNWSVSEEINNIRLSIYNTSGQLVKEIEKPNLEINVSKLSGGLYFVKINSDLGSATKKIIIE